MPSFTAVLISAILPEINVLDEVSSVTIFLSFISLIYSFLHSSGVLPVATIWYWPTFTIEYSFTAGTNVSGYGAYPGEEVKKGQVLAYNSAESLIEKIEKQEESIQDAEISYLEYLEDYKKDDLHSFTLTGINNNEEYQKFGVQDELQKINTN